ncbi:tetratricopeptide repeat protein [Methanobrevibacter sp.]|uniref:tetratricopeptide repeat protein n=1 Tax=Methanobrevibacter sp. TaxID=66852 RepID=UPI003890425A
MSFNELPDICDDLAILENGDRVRIQFGNLKTDWIGRYDSFLKRISPENLNEFFLVKHLEKEIQIKNVLDEGIDFLNSERYPKAIDRFDRVLYYDSGYGDALISKSHALCGQGHFVKALRFFRRSGVEDNDYYKLLLARASEERDSFPKIKRNIYAGDEAASRGEFERAVDFYERALVDPSKFKNKILFKLLNKKACVLIKLERFDEALAGFDASIRVHENDLAYFGLGYCQYNLGLDCIGSLNHARRIGKKCLLIKAGILNEFSCFDDALRCLDEFLANHFMLDDDFRLALQGKAAALDGLSLDGSHEREILSEIGKKGY